MIMTKPTPLQKRLVLASKSPRRSQLLELAGFNFVVHAKDTPEDFPEHMPPDEVAEFLARKKAEAAREFLDRGDVILAADSIVVLENHIYGKPTDRNDAIRTLQRLSGCAHRVLTGVCLLSAHKTVSFTAVAKVALAELTQEEIEFYVDTYEPYDKAGAYAIQEWIGLAKITRIEGTYPNIMGLPVNLVYEALLDF